MVGSGESERVRMGLEGKRIRAWLLGKAKIGMHIFQLTFFHTISHNV